MQLPFAAGFIQPTIQNRSRYVSSALNLATCRTIRTLTYFAAETTFCSLLTADRTCSRSACVDSRHSVQRRLDWACIVCGQCSVCVNSCHSVQRRLARACVHCGQCKSVSIRATACKDVWPVRAFFVVNTKVCQFAPQHAKTSDKCLRSFSVFSCSVCASLCAVGVGGQ